MAGRVTLNDMMEAILGSMPDQDQREQGENAWIADAQMDIEDVAAATGLVLPHEGERFTSGAHELEITDTDRQRIDKVTVPRLPPPEASGWIRRAGGSARA